MKTHSGKIDLGIELPTPSAAIRGVIKNELNLKKMINEPIPDNEHKRLAWENEVNRLRAALDYDKALYTRETLYYRLACCWDGKRRLNAVQAKIGFSFATKQVAEFTLDNLNATIARIEKEITEIENELALKTRLERYGKNLLMENPLAAATPEINTPVWGARR